MEKKASPGDIISALKQAKKEAATEALASAKILLTPLNLTVKEIVGVRVQEYAPSLNNYYSSDGSSPREHSYRGMPMAVMADEGSGSSSGGESGGGISLVSVNVILSCRY